MSKDNTVGYETYANLILTGHSIDFKRISISPYERLGRTYFQVHSDDYRDTFSKMFRDEADAVEAFIKLKRSLYGKRKRD